MSQWGRVKFNLDAGNQFTNAESDVEPLDETDDTLRVFEGMTVGGIFDLSFIQASVVAIKRLVIDAANAGTWALQLETTTEAGTELRTLVSDGDFLATPNQQIWHPAMPVVIDQAHGDKLVLITTAATGAMIADLLVSSW